MNFSKMHIVEPWQEKGPCKPFALREREEKKPQGGLSMKMKMSLCLLVMALALTVELTGLGEKTEEPPENQEEALGALHYVDGQTGESLKMVLGEKWQTPVLCGQVRLMQEEGLLGFQALTKEVRCCCGGTVLMTGEDADLGLYARISLDRDRETVYYGFDTLEVQAKETVAVGQRLGTVSPGQTLYLAVTDRGEPLDPRDYVQTDMDGEKS